LDARHFVKFDKQPERMVKRAAHPVDRIAQQALVFSLKLTAHDLGRQIELFAQRQEFRSVTDERFGRCWRKACPRARELGFSRGWGKSKDSQKPYGSGSKLPMAGTN
jgi:hypothetical protein